MKKKEEREREKECRGRYKKIHDKVTREERSDGKIPGHSSSYLLPGNII